MQMYIEKSNKSIYHIKKLTEKKYLMKNTNQSISAKLRFKVHIKIEKTTEFHRECMNKCSCNCKWEICTSPYIIMRNVHKSKLNLIILYYVTNYTIAAVFTKKIHI